MYYLLLLARWSVRQKLNHVRLSFEFSLVQLSRFVRAFKRAFRLASRAYLLARLLILTNRILTSELCQLISYE